MSEQLATPPISESFHRDKPVIVSYAQASCYGWFIFASGPAINLLRDEFNLSRTQAAFHSVGMALGGITAGLLVGALIKRFGRGLLLRASSLVVMLGIIFFTSGHQLHLTVMGAFLVTLGGSTIVQSTAAFLSQHRKKFAPGAIAELHGFVAVVGAVSPLIMGYRLTKDYGWRSTIQVLVIAVLAVELIRGRNIHIYNQRCDLSNDNSRSQQEGRLPRLFWWAALIMGFTSGVEASIILWSGDYLRSQGGLASGASTAAVACVVAGMCIGRLSGPTITRYWESEILYITSLVTALFGFVSFWLVPAVSAMMISLFITGLGLSLHFPFGIERAIRASFGHPDKASSRIIIVTGLASGIVPLFIGWLADQSSMHEALVVIPIFLICATVCSRIFKVQIIES